MFKSTSQLLHSDYFQKQWLFLQTVPASDLLELVLDLRQLRRRVPALENHHVVEVHLLFAVDFSQPEVDVVYCLHEVVAGVEALVGVRRLAAHCTNKL